jgi:hypothetical protein
MKYAHIFRDSFLILSVVSRVRYYDTYMITMSLPLDYDGATIGLRGRHPWITMVPLLDYTLHNFLSHFFFLSVVSLLRYYGHTMYASMILIYYEGDTIGDTIRLQGCHY